MSEMGSDFTIKTELFFSKKLKNQLIDGFARPAD